MPLILNMECKDREDMFICLLSGVFKKVLAE